jgi:predicted RNase H-like HicB family nuclease
MQYLVRLSYKETEAMRSRMRPRLNSCYNPSRGEKAVKFNIILEPAAEGGFNVTVPALDGCFTQGDTEAQALKNAKEAIICYLEGLQKLNQIKTKPNSRFKQIEVTF